MKYQNRTTAAVLAAGAVLTCSAGLVAGRAGAQEKQMTVAMITHAQPGDTFWDIIRKGAEAAAKANCGAHCERPAARAASGGTGAILPIRPRRRQMGCASNSGLCCGSCRFRSAFTPCRSTFGNRSPLGDFSR